MEREKLTVWIVELIVIWAVLFLIQLPVRRKERPVLRTAVFVIKVLLIPCTALCVVAFVNAVSYRHGDILTMVYVALMGDAAASVAECAVRRVRPPRDKGAGKGPCGLKLTGVLSILFCLCGTVCGVVNAGHVMEKSHEWSAEGLTQPHTFAFAADLHTGSAQSMDTLRELCRQINEAGPEFVILGGDVTDEHTSFDEMVMTYRILSEIEAPVFFIYGNHDRQPDGDLVGGRTYRDKDLSQALRAAGIRVLSDEYVKVAEDLILLGREDMSAGDGRKPWTRLKNPYEGEGALVVADHQPYDEAQLAAEESALQLSGHTHAGQLWPLRFVYRVLGLPAYGEFEEPGTRLYVTAGASVWMMPLRTEAHCEWDLITLRP